MFGYEGRREKKKDQYGWGIVLKFNQTKVILTIDLSLQYPLKQKQVPRPLRHSVCRRQQVKESKQDEPQHQQQYQNQRRGRRVMAYEKGRCMLPLGLPQSAWPPLQVKSTQHQHHQQSHNSSGKSTGVFLGGANAKRECAGTGVFLPRTYTKTSDRKKKSGKTIYCHDLVAYLRDLPGASLVICLTLILF